MHPELLNLLQRNHQQELLHEAEQARLIQQIKYVNRSNEYALQPVLWLQQWGAHVVSAIKQASYWHKPADVAGKEELYVCCQ